MLHRNLGGLQPEPELLAVFENGLAPQSGYVSNLCSLKQGPLEPIQALPNQQSPRNIGTRIQSGCPEGFLLERYATRCARGTARVETSLNCGDRTLASGHVPCYSQGVDPMAVAATFGQLAILLGVLLAGTAAATTYSTVIPVKAKGSGPLYRIQRYGKWGYMTRSGQVVIPPRFTDARDFFDELAAVRLREKWGYIKESGEFAIPPRFDAATDFQQERASVTVSGRAGLIDRSGAFVVKFAHSPMD